MGKMPVDREKRWQSVFRRYGIAGGSENHDEIPEDKMEALKENVLTNLFPAAKETKLNKSNKK